MRTAQTSKGFAQMIEEEFGRDTQVISETNHFGIDGFEGAAGELADLVHDAAFWDWFSDLTYLGCGQVVDEGGNVVLEKAE